MSGDGGLMHVDWVATEDDLRDARVRREIKVQMFRELQAFGHVNPRTIRLVREPPDGPYADGSVVLQPGHIPIRMAAWVTPIRRT